ncbi:hypothetical protein [Naasia lichenicola]|uniref:DUF732 domain-containing protein n=1 Tax=Naasia lichenicola TaxID=2565933 RepID=A0A4S4FJ58_9MICO|nr:hypothetical protein [Naasia lichenicola]THG29882.1 hypothetical protein E6C64_14625 [Naasia lichenicola]
MNRRLSAASVVLIAFALAVTGCSSSAPATGPSTSIVSSGVAPAEETSGPDSADDAGSADSTDELAAALDALIPGLGDADSRPAQDICGMLQLGTDRQTIELTAAGGYASYVEGGIIDAEQASQIVDVVAEYC